MKSLLCRGLAAIAAWLPLVLPAHAAPAAPKADASSVSYQLGTLDTVRSLYPDASWLPAPYQPYYKDLAETIRKYTLQSLQRDGVENPTVDVQVQGTGAAAKVSVTIRPRNAVTQRYATVHPAFLARGQAARTGVAACEKDKACWKDDSATRPHPHGGPQPWALYLPFGMAMAKAQGVMFMDYPPAVSLQQADYLSNFTMCRWNQVMGAAGSPNPLENAVIIDARPIAAPGAGEDALMPNPATWFNSKTGAEYLTPMLQLRTARAGTKAATTLPVTVFGATPRAAWGELVGQKNLHVGSVGSTALGGQKAKTPWLATNHPDVTTYNCCPGDGSASCKGSTRLVESAQTDFIAACWTLAMSGAKPPAPDAAHQQCTAAWKDQPTPANKQALCVQAKFDNQNKAARCSTYEEAWNYCAAHGGNPCATLDCQVDAKAEPNPPLPPPDKRPWGSAKACAMF
ncbi:hypothetical protein [Aquabacterium humicola]|uniref:hypothetical protein n=1 Tax=Aquabacterium humicola TaxID=3237377 RepID=UPI002542C5B6|nr:hypothetical protein [Rubrivivax pictus]